MNLFRPLWLGAFGYIVVTLLFLVLLTPHHYFSQHLSLFYHDPSITDNVHIAIIANPSGTHAILTRFFHNKATFSLNNLYLSLARSTDPVMFFSLFQAPYYGDSWYTFTSPLYFPFFVIGALTLIRKWDKIKKNYRLLPYFFVFSLVVAALFIPYTAPLKLIPLFIFVQLVIFFGCYELMRSIWVKK